MGGGEQSRKAAKEGALPVKDSDSSSGAVD